MSVVKPVVGVVALWRPQPLTTVNNNYRNRERVTGLREKGRERKIKRDGEKE
jgi:hypothetical protein